ncbi:MAG: hypothetical protein HY231_21795 [Acidobacteria bacterium]|nr:hypothetical protein [Acidobacteriota bacterium]
MQKTAKKKSARKSSSKKVGQPRPYKLPKTAAELGITCFTEVAGEKCGKPAIWFDYQLGEKEFYSGFVCAAHRRSNRVEKLAQPQAIPASA